MNASSGRTRMSRLRRDDAGAEASRESARAMFSSTRPSLGENWRVAIRIVRGGLHSQPYSYLRRLLRRSYEAFVLHPSRREVKTLHRLGN